MEDKSNLIYVCDYAQNLKTKANVETDVIVPDIKPDIYRILCVRALGDVSECYMKKDKIIFSGKARFNILYVGENDPCSVSTIECSVPFSHESDFEGVTPETFVKTSCRLISTSYDVKNSRKLSVSAFFCFKADALRQTGLDTVSADSLSQDTPYTTKDISYDYLATGKDFDITLSDSLTLPASGDSCEVYDVCVRPDVTDIKIVNNKAIVKGRADILVLYFSGGKICNYNTEATFTEIVDVTELDDNQTVFSDFNLSDSSYSLVPSDTGMRLDFDFKISGNICAYEKRLATITQDVYSPDFSYNIKSRKAGLLKIAKCDDVEEIIKENITLSDSDSPISEVYLVDVIPSVVSVKNELNHIKIDASADCTMIYSDEGANLHRTRQTVPFEIKVLTPDDFGGAFADADILCKSLSYTLNSSKEIQLRAVVRASIKLSQTTQTDFILEFGVDTSSPLQKEQQAGIIVYYPQEGTPLWDVAKKYNTTCEDIIATNGLDASQTLLSSEPLLIPKRKKCL